MSSKLFHNESNDIDIQNLMSFVDSTLIPSYEKRWNSVLGYQSQEVQQFVADMCRSLQVSSEMIFLSLLCVVGSVAGNRIMCDYAEGKFTNLCTNMVLAAPTNSRKFQVHGWLSDILDQFAESLECEGKIPIAYVDGKITRSGLMTALEEKTAGRKTLFFVAQRLLATEGHKDAHAQFEIRNVVVVFR
jgi:hypothetical protein